MQEWKERSERERITELSLTSIETAPPALVEEQFVKERLVRVKWDVRYDPLREMAPPLEDVQ